MTKTQPAPKGPKFVAYFEPILAALRTLGGSARPPEVREEIARSLQISEAAQTETLASGGSRFNNQVAWARFYLARAGLVDASSSGIWTLTEQGRQLPRMTPDEAFALFKATDAQFRTERTGPGVLPEVVENTAAPAADAESLAESNHRQRVLEVLRNLPPAGFERFCSRLLRESGFQEVTVTGKSGDGGIDGIGILQVNLLVSFKVLFQCKRYAGTVTPSQVRDFRGAMQGRADMGIILTTGSFTSDAKKEATRDGVPPIELVDSDKLIDMLEKLELGLEPIRTYRVQEAFFAEFKV
jgi:restriction system protein